MDPIAPTPPVPTAPTTTRTPLPLREPCRYEGAELDVQRGVRVRSCKLYGKCTRTFLNNLTRSCGNCNGYIPATGKYPEGYVAPVVPPPSVVPNAPVTATRAIDAAVRSVPQPGRNVGRRDPRTIPPVLATRASGRKTLRWSYGITTVPERFDTTFPKSFEGLKRAGFDAPILFVDGTDYDGAKRYKEVFGTDLLVTIRWPRIRAYGNWILALGELYIRQPFADRFALFQDDILVSSNLRAYLDRIEFPKKGYLNLYTFPENQHLALDREGFYKSNQNGKGALGLVFDQEGVRFLLANNHMVGRLTGADWKQRGHRYIDGAVVETMRSNGWTEYVHSPSLLDHTGVKSTLNNPKFDHRTSFRGEAFDLLTLLGGDRAVPSAGPEPRNPEGPSPQGS